MRRPAADGTAASQASELQARLTQARGRRLPPDAIVAIELEVEPGSPARLFDSSFTTAVCYAPAGQASVALGRTSWLCLEGHDRAAVARFGEETFQRILWIGPHSVEPRILGGASFSPSSVRQDPWRQFGAVRFQLPRWHSRVEGERAVLQFYGEVRDLTPDGAARTVAEFLQLRRRIGRARIKPPSGKVRLRQLPEAHWGAMVDDALRRIRLREFRKVVVARTARLGTARPWSVEQLLARLGDSGRTAFAFREQDWVFAGATPELLIRKLGDRVETEALAGTIGAGQPASGLLKSDKNLREHQLVVQEILRRLRPRCRTLEAEPPALRQLQDVQHLASPIAGRLKRTSGSSRVSRGPPVPHIIDLAFRLHPTPAVGGLPAKPALDWIAAHEPDERGWYAGFIGYFDAAGDGEFSVAIRSGLVRSGEARIYTGAGIVDGAVAAAEYHETQLKQRPFLRALGVVA